MAIIMEVEQLVAPLCYYSDGVLDKSDDDEKTTDGGEVTIDTG